MNRTFLSWPIYYMMVSKIYKHFNRDADIPEHYTDQQKAEQAEFTGLLARTRIFQRLRTFFNCKGKLSVRFTVMVVHWQKLIDCFLKAIVPVTNNVLPLISIISHLTQSTRHCCGRGHSPRRCGSGAYLGGRWDMSPFGRRRRPAALSAPSVSLSMRARIRVFDYYAPTRAQSTRDGVLVCSWLLISMWVSLIRHSRRPQLIRRRCRHQKCPQTYPEGFLLHIGHQRRESLKAAENENTIRFFRLYYILTFSLVFAS